MPRYTATTTIVTDRGESLTASKAGNYEDIFNIRQEVNDSTSFIPLIVAGKDIASNSLRDANAIIIKNDGDVSAEIQLTCNSWSTNISDEAVTDQVFEHFVLGAGDYIFLPNMKNITSLSDNSGMRGAAKTNNLEPADVNSGALYADSTVNLNAALEDSHTVVNVADLDFFRVGDLIQVGINDTTATRIEIMRVTAKAADTGAGEMTVDRALYGTSKADKDAQTDSTNGAVSGANVHFPFFNEYGDYDTSTKLTTDSSGRLKISNMMGYARTADQIGDGISAITGKFYQSGYQELGLSGITPSTKTGLVASTAYKIDITVDGGTMFQDLTVTTDSSNGNFGGRNGLIQKIQDALDVQYYTAGNLFEKKVTVGIVGGDIRFTSGSHLATSAISLTDTGDSLSLFDAAAVGRIPAVTDLQSPVAARLPDDTVFNNKSGNEAPNKGAFFYDDGHGNIKGSCTGTINYETGAMDLQGCPPNADLALSFDYNGGLSGGNEFGTTIGNSIDAIGARSGNSKINTTIEIIGLK